MGGDGRSLNNHQDISQTSNQYPMALGAPKPSYSKLTLMSSKQLAEHGDNHLWHAETQHCFKSHGLSIDAISLFQYSIDCPHLNMTKAEKNKVIRTDIINLDNGRVWISPTTSEW